MRQFAEAWLSTIDQAQELEKQKEIEITESPAVKQITDRILVDTRTRFQEMDGFGASFTDASAYLVYKVLPEDERKKVMKHLFDPNEGIGISFLRQVIGASDYTSEIYSYNDLPEGQEDFELKQFSIDHDRDYIIPAVLEALSINPILKSWPLHGAHPAG